MTLQDMRTKAGLTQAKLAGLAGVSDSRIDAWEAWDGACGRKDARDPRLMRLGTATKLADALGMTLDEFHRNL